MAITKETVVDKVESLENGQLGIRTATVIKEDGVELTRTLHRHVPSEWAGSLRREFVDDHCARICGGPEPCQQRVDAMGTWRIRSRWCCCAF